MKMKFSMCALMLAFGFAIVSVGCDSGSKKPAPADKAEAKPKDESTTSVASNTLCPIMGSEVDPEAEMVSFKGETIGFCCDGCDEKWAKLSDEEKEKKLAEAKTKAEAKS